MVLNHCDFTSYGLLTPLAVTMSNNDWKNNRLFYQRCERQSRKSKNIAPKTAIPGHGGPASYVTKQEHPVLGISIRAHGCS